MPNFIRYRQFKTFFLTGVGDAQPNKKHKQQFSKLLSRNSDLDVDGGELVDQVDEDVRNLEEKEKLSFRVDNIYSRKWL